MSAMAFALLRGCGYARAPDPLPGHPPAAAQVTACGGTSNRLRRHK